MVYGITFVGRTLEELEMDFFQHRDNYPNLCIITPYDDSKSMYTKTSPTKEVLRRVSVLAKFCYETFCNSLTGDSLIDVKVCVSIMFFWNLVLI